jgi:hypothetical protein
MAMPCPGTGAVQFAAITAQLTALLPQFAALFAHFMAIADDIAVDGTRPGMTLSGVAMGLREGRGQREERGCEQKLAHRILLQTGSQFARPPVNNIFPRLNRTRMAL